MEPVIIVGAAQHDLHHREIARIARLSKFTKDFEAVRYIKDYYDKGWMAVAIHLSEVQGFACIRHCVRQPWTTIYYLGVRTQRLGIGRELLRWVKDTSPHREIRLGVDRENDGAKSFWLATGFVSTGEETYPRAGGTIDHYRLEW